MARRKYGRFTYKRKAALHKAQLASARKRRGMSTRKKLAIAGGVGVIAAGVAGVMYGRAVIKGGPKNVINHTPPQAVEKIGKHTVRTDLPPWQIGDKVHPEVGDAVEVSLKNMLTGKGYSRFYGKVVSQKWGRHLPLYGVMTVNPKTGVRFEEFIHDYGITGIKVGGAANLEDSVKSLQEERKRHRY